MDLKSAVPESAAPPLTEPHAASAPPCAFILFGATGDLTRRKIVPALFSLATQNLLPKGFVIVAFARRDKTDDSFREELRAAIREFARTLPAQPLDSTVQRVDLIAELDKVKLENEILKQQISDLKAGREATSTDQPGDSRSSN